MPQEPFFTFRKEPFGGIIFGSDDALFLEFDGEAYDVLVRWYRDRKRPSTLREAGLLISVAREIGLFPKNVTFMEQGETEDLGVPVFRSPTLVDIQITDKCFLNCPHCYASSTPSGEHLPFDEIKRVFDQLELNGVCQIAIGGGEPLLHPHFIDILRLARKKRMVPNVTTSGTALNKDKIDALKAFCGAVALSLEEVGDGFGKRRKSGFSLFERTLEKLMSAQIPTVVQVTLSHENLDHIFDIVNYCKSISGLYGVIFLAYKEVGRGIGFNNPLAKRPAGEVYKILSQAFLDLSQSTRVGYDCCLAPGIAGLDKEVGFASHDMIEGCSAMRHSFGLDTKLNVIPCTFVQDRVMGNLKETPLKEVWDHSNSQSFRSVFKEQVATNSACRRCSNRSTCHGGCPVFSLVNCSNDYMNHRSV